MEITLEKIELVKDRTGVSYKEAKEALEHADGNEIEAIIYIEENIDDTKVEEKDSKAEEFISFIKETIKKGNVNRIKVYKDDEILVNLPVSAGIIGIVLMKWWGIVAAVFATGVCKCRVELVKEDGEVIDVTDKANDALNIVKDKGGVLADEVVDKSSDLYEAAKAKGIDLYSVAKEKGSELYETVKDKAADFINNLPKDNGDDLVDDAADDASEIDLDEK